MTTQRIAPQCGRGLILEAHQTLRVATPVGEQVADLVTFSLEDKREWISSGRTIDFASSIFLGRGSKIYSNRSRVMLQITEDTVGRHDFLLAPCSREMFRILHGIDHEHPSCLTNLATALAPYAIEADEIPTTLNLFMRVDVDGRTGAIEVLPPMSRAGDYVDLRAEMDLIVGLTACSAEQTNNGSFKPIDFSVLV